MLLYLLNYVRHICRAKNTNIAKMFAEATKGKCRDPWNKVSSVPGVPIEQAQRATQSRNEFPALVQKCITTSRYQNPYCSKLDTGSRSFWYRGIGDVFVFTSFLH